MANTNLAPDLILVGASVRAAAHSAWRGGWTPLACDLFGDADLSAVATHHPVGPAGYPQGVLQTLETLPRLPVVFTGGLENHPDLLDAIAARQPLLGIHGAALRSARDPFLLRDALLEQRLHAPDVLPASEPTPREGAWIAKPLKGAGGAGIRPAVAGVRHGGGLYLQKRVDGRPAAAAFVATDGHARLLGVTLQLVGTPWLGAAPFAYCGSVGPISLPGELEDQVTRTGQAVAAAFDLQGSFGLDVVLADHRAWVVELNPRYTASTEILEHTSGFSALRSHIEAWEYGESPTPRDGGRHDQARRHKGGILAKAIVFATGDVVVREPPAWRLPPSWGDLSDFADIPRAGELIRRGRPITTCFARGHDVEGCLAALRDRCERLGRQTSSW